MRLCVPTKQALGTMMVCHRWMVGWGGVGALTAQRERQEAEGDRTAIEAGSHMLCSDHEQDVLGVFDCKERWKRAGWAMRLH